MDRYFTMFGPLAWPVATLIIALIFRKDLGKAMGRVGQFKYRDLELTFRDDLRQAEQLARSIPPAPARPAVVLEVATDEAKELGGRLIVSPSSSDSPAEETGSPFSPVDPSPRGEIESAWNLVTRALAKATKLEGDRRASRPMKPEVAAQFLVNRGRLAPPEALLVGLLRTLRDRASRLDQPPPSPEDTRRYVDLATRLTSRIEGLR